MRRASIALMACSWLLLAATALGEERATVTMRSGEVLSGVLVEFDAKGIWLRVNGQDRALSPNDVALIQFSDPGPAADDVRTKLAAGQPFAVLKNGVPVDGRLVDIGGNVPLLLTLRTAAGDRELNSNEVAQIYLAVPPQATAQAAAPAAQPAPARGAIRVDASRRWVDTGLRVDRGDRVAFSASGTIQFSGTPGHTSGPGGNPSVQNPDLPVSSMPVGGLIGRVGTGAPFPIGSNNEPIAMPDDGRLLIGVNDSHLEDNQGAFDVTVRRGRARR
jgi:hypothetical protein